MTKREFLESCDFNNLNLRKQITASIDAIDYDTSNKKDSDLINSWQDEDGKTWSHANDELRELNLSIMKDYPMFEIILLKYKSMHKDHTFSIDNLYNVVLPIWSQKKRSEQLNKLYDEAKNKD
jgi:hypothetical protein